MKILIVIVNYNGKHLLQKNLQTVVDNGYDNFDIVVVDNASVDGSVEYLKQKFPSVNIVESVENLGFGRGNNLGVEKYPNYDAYLFLNNDVSVPKGFLNNMIQVLKREDVGAVGPKVLYSKKKEGIDGKERYVINSAGIDVDEHYMSYDRYDKEEDNSKYGIVEEVDALMGGAFLVKGEVFDKVKGFNPQMFLYYEDIDFSLRIRDLGYKLYYVGTSEVYHDHMASSKSLGVRKRNIMNMMNRFRSVKSRKGTWVAIRETIWYLFNWIVWKVIYSQKITLKEYFKRK